MANEFDSAWLKWGWAVRHAEFLQNDIAGYRPTRPDGRVYTTRSEYDAKRHCIILRADTVDPIPDRWSLQLGDIVHGYRSCLDHVAWALYKRGKTPNLPKKETSVMFPVMDTATELKNALPRRIPGIRRPDEGVVRRHQPYRSRSRRGLRYHVYSILVPMSNHDKHRTIRPLFATLGDGSWAKVDNPRDCTITRAPTEARRLPIEVGGEIDRVYVRKTGPNPRLDLDAFIRPWVTVEAGVTIQEWLTQARSFTYQLLDEFQQPPKQRLRGVGITIGVKAGQTTVSVTG